MPGPDLPPQRAGCGRVGNLRLGRDQVSDCPWPNNPQTHLDDVVPTTQHPVLASASRIRSRNVVPIREQAFDSLRSKWNRVSARIRVEATAADRSGSRDNGSVDVAVLQPEGREVPEN